MTISNSLRLMGLASMATVCLVACSNDKNSGGGSGVAGADEGPDLGAFAKQVPQPPVVKAADAVPDIQASAGCENMGLRVSNPGTFVSGNDSLTFLPYQKGIVPDPQIGTLDLVARAGLVNPITRKTLIAEVYPEHKDGTDFGGIKYIDTGFASSVDIRVEATVPQGGLLQFQIFRDRTQRERVGPGAVKKKIYGRGENVAGGFFSPGSVPVIDAYAREGYLIGLTPRGVTYVNLDASAFTEGQPCFMEPGAGKAGCLKYTIPFKAIIEKFTAMKNMDLGNDNPCKNQVGTICEWDWREYTLMAFVDDANGRQAGKKICSVWFDLQI